MSDRSSPISVPRLRTSRLVLREYRREDFDAFASRGLAGARDRLERPASALGRRIATEAAAEAVRYAFEVRRERIVIAVIRPANAASLRVAERLGMTCDGDVPLFGTPARRYVRRAT